MQSRPVRAVRLQPQQPTSDLPFPEGAPNPDSQLEVLIDRLNAGEYCSDQLARVDDFVVRTCFESKYKKTRLRDSEAPKFIPGAPISSALSLKIAKEWMQVREGPLETWYDGAKGIWQRIVLEAIGNGASDGNLEIGDADLFSHLLVRYYLIYHSHSPIKLGIVRFPGDSTPQRGIVARNAINQGSFLLEAGGMVSKDAPSRNLGGFSTIEHKGARDKSLRLLAGPIRFANHHCRPNCELWNIVELQSTSMSPSNFYTLRAARNIAAGEEITVTYGNEYFRGGLKCLCDHCVPRDSVPASGGSASVDPDNTRDDLKVAKKRVRNGKGTHRMPKKLRGDAEVAN